MITVVRFKAEHYHLIEQQESEAYLRGYITPETLAAVERSRWAYTGVSHTGKIVVCAGIVEHWQGRGTTWAVLAKECRREFLAIHNAIKSFLADCPLRRIEAHVDVNFKAAHRWAKALGFELEAPLLKKFLVNGEDVSLYARVR